MYGKAGTQRIECEQRMRQSDMAFQAWLFSEILGSKNSFLLSYIARAAKTEIQC